MAAELADPQKLKEKEREKLKPEAAKHVPRTNAYGDALPDTILQLQSIMGNRVVLKMIAAGVIKPHQVQSDLEAGLSLSGLLGTVMKAQLEATGQFSRGQNYLNQRSFGNAVVCFTRAIAMGEDSPEVYIARARAYYELGKYAEAIRDLTRALEMDPNNTEALTLRGWCYIKLGEYELARREFQQALAADASDEGSKEGMMMAAITERVKVTVISGKNNQGFDLKENETMILLDITEETDFDHYNKLSDEGKKKLVLGCVKDAWTDPESEVYHIRVAYKEKVYASATTTTSKVGVNNLVLTTLPGGKDLRHYQAEPEQQKKDAEKKQKQEEMEEPKGIEEEPPEE
ncbi:MAG: tetratricopeptide repeat protein [Firmicutes bacterium]|nr:tetratricopeptide repeat protein [Bacillota bacterium]